MKIKCNKDHLSNAWSIATAVVPSKPIRPILSHIKLSAGSDGLELFATDMEIGVRYTVPEAIIEEEGEALIPASLMGSILRDAWGEGVEIIYKDGASDIKLAESSFHILGDSVENFPPVPSFDTRNTFSLSKDALIQMVELTRFSVAREDTRYALNGIFVEMKKGVIRMVSTDGRRLSRAEMKPSKSAKTSGSAIVTVPGFDEIIRCLTEEDEEVVLSLDDNMLHARTKNAQVFAKLIEGTFPNYSEVIPKGHNKKAIFGSEDLLPRLKQAAKITSEESRAVRFSFGKGKLIMSSSSPEMGEATIEMAVKYEGDDIEIRFNPAFLVDVLRALPGKEVSMALSEPAQPCIISCGKEFLYVVMPVNVD